MTTEEFINSIKLEGEEWRNVVNWEGLYYISSYGRIVRSKTKTCPTKLMKPYSQINRKKTYYSIKLQTSNKRESWLIHRLVAIAFLSNPENLQCVDHIDGDSTNNNVSNLAWCTYHTNNMNTIAIQRQSESHKGKLNTSQNKEVVQLKDGKIIKIYRTMTDPEKEEEKFCHSCIHKVCNGKALTHKGYQWMYLSDYETLINKSKNP